MTIALALIFGVVVGSIMGGLGGGGAILTVPILVYILGESAQAATTSSLVIVGVAAIVGVITHARDQHVKWAVGAIFGAAGVAAAVLGTVLNRLVEPNVLLLAFAGVMLLAAAAMLIKSHQRSPRPAESALETVPVDAGSVPAGRAVDSPDRARRVTVGLAARILIGGLAVGFLTGFFGVGGGFVVVPVLVLLLDLQLSHAVGTSLLVMAINAAASIAARAGDLDLDPRVVIPFTVTAMAGTIIGRHLAHRLPERVLLVSFAGLLITVAAYVTVRSVVSPLT